MLLFVPVYQQQLLNVQFPFKSKSKILITDITGRVLIEKTIEEENLKQVQFDLSTYDNGIYFVTVQETGKTFVRKFLKE